MAAATTEPGVAVPRRFDLVRIIRFGWVSLVGLVCDYAIYALLHAGAGLPAGVANLFSATVGITVVYFLSLRQLFSHLPTPPRATLVRYLAYQAVAVPLASVAVGALESWLNAFLLAKTLVLPVSFASNYLFMHWLLHRADTAATPAAGRIADGPLGTAAAPVTQVGDR
ncbi:MAG: GtrA family protein [Solirubrobacteraceae bacterium]|nr:GtrA family protein [Patulibacter sp.]